MIEFPPSFSSLVFPKEEEDGDWDLGIGDWIFGYGGIEVKLGLGI